MDKALVICLSYGWVKCYKIVASVATLLEISSLLSAVAHSAMGTLNRQWT